MRLKSLCVFAALCAAVWVPPGGPAIADSDFESGLETYGDIMQIVIPATAAAISLGKEDYNGTLQLTTGALVTFGVVMGLKEAVDSNRPNGKSKSFPSGHTSSAFSGASFLHYRYGWEYGLPAYGAAALVGVSRITASKHYWYDVVAGAAIANGIAYVFTDTIDDDVIIIPVLEKRKKNFEVLLKLGLQF